MPTPAPHWSQSLLSIADDIAQTGFSIQKNIVPERTANGLYQDIITLEKIGAFRPAGIGHEHQHHINQRVRSDKVLWLDEDYQEGIALNDFWGLVSELRLTLNRTLFLGLQDLEAHYAVYPKGAFYKRHRDRFKNSDSRQLTFLFYLNPHWQPGHGGELWLYKDTQKPPIVIQPHFNTFVCFLSDMLHEVRPTHQKRYSLTGWFLRQAINNPLPVLLLNT